MLYKVILCILVALIFILGFHKVLADDSVMAPIELSIREKIQMAFGSTSPMLAIVQCESEFRQFDSLGKPLRSHTSDIGIMQINQIHWPRAEKLGLDIFWSMEDNIKMGQIILKEQGYEAWTCSRVDS